MKKLMEKFVKHPLGVLYSVLLGIVAFWAAYPMAVAGMWEAALVDLVMAVMLIWIMLKRFSAVCCRQSTLMEKIAAWIILVGVNLLALLPTQEFPGSLSAALACALLICAFVLYFSGTVIALISVMPALWCCVFMPYHEEFMLLLSYPLRLSATMLSSVILKLFGIGVVWSGTQLELPGLDIAITDACSGINQLDAFILIAFIAVRFLHKKSGWKILHFAFIIPAIIVGNSLRIVLTVLLYRFLGEVVLQNSWHIALGYGQIIMALLIFLGIGRILSVEEEKGVEKE